jgi:hypothetical protein
MTRRSAYNIDNSWNYMKLALKSANHDQDLAEETVRQCTALRGDETVDIWRREGIQRMALALAALMASTSAEAKCHHYSIWKYPWPQQVCAATGKAAVVSLRGRGAAAADATWYVEITRPPIDNDDEAREAGIDALKQKLNQ